MEVILKYFSDFTDTQIRQLEALETLYKDWNEKINVISRKDIDSLYERHVLHALSIAALYPFEAGSKIVDLGCGGGFPGIPLAIYFPEIHFHMVDSIAKKLKVVNEVADAIGLKNITTQHTRIEEIKDKKFDYVVSRAVAPLKDLWQWSKLLIQGSKERNYDEAPAPGLICLKGGDLAKEIQESGTRPYVTAISDLFKEDFFDQKYVLYVPK
ncbi:MAG TPA: 16S rRNA (guanine(527)-N(7))-methyltransferase RsmG [Niabella sp.]|nr:16S rRNA (guanine(527)-N(7))-methyltransferase RsmG [Niabella sp.]HQW14673.1 16S rRNA (guanine(527)-N(7))-methyltransferase RsmG [Niabella sp.]HQX19812.1 16S rRNA (guanine(527)-N(7))-methyltransferase RsmG [Niabella sp.]HQX42277.1 16S rRNA (guanine(527)-N(7))-methyltransferase RsmG [Niabella sp.]HRB08330.1 16S rRNA (guanine(527)-N(7))-methyltransferase RsmG [Niabella sp.]